MPLPICFETRLTEKLAASFIALCFVLFALAISGMLVLCCYAVRSYALPFAGMFAATIIFIAFFFVYYQRRILPGIRFCLIFYRNHFQMGRALTKQLFSYKEVDRIHVSKDKGILVGCGKNSATVCLNGKERQDCARLLQFNCSNAIFIDEYGHEHFPATPTHPERTLIGLERHHRRMMWLYIILSVSIMGQVLRYWMVVRPAGRNLSILLAATGIFAFFCLKYAWRSWQIARLACRRRVKALPSGDVVHTDIESGVSSDSSSRMNGVK